jgi:hypothetical protein
MFTIYTFVYSNSGPRGHTRKESFQRKETSENIALNEYDISI